MKKNLIITIALAAVTSIGLTSATPVNLDTLEKTFSASAKRQLQSNYLGALRTRYQNLYNNEIMDRDYFNVKTRKASLKAAQKAAHTMGGVKSILSRTGEMEQDKERVQETTPYQVKAVNSKSIFLKRAMDYYVYDGDAGTDIMEEGNINMRDHKVSTTKMLDLMIKHKKETGDITMETRNLQKAMAATPNEDSIKRTSNYRTGNFRNNMLSPFTSLKWLNQ